MIFIAVMKFYFTLVMEWLHVYLQFLLCEDIVVYLQLCCLLSHIALVAEIKS